MSGAQAVDSSIRRIAEEVAAWLTTGSTPSDGDALRRGARTLIDAKSVPRPLPVRRLPVCAFWDQALAFVRGARAERIAARLRDLAPALSWMQNPNYTAAVMGAPWLRNYGYVELIGGDGHQLADGVRMGVMLLGPQTLYPPHRHPAEEAYLVLGGAADWQRGDEPWQTRAPGAVIYHPAGLVHATRTRHEPLLVAYLWWGAVAARARVLRAGG